MSAKRRDKNGWLIPMPGTQLEKVRAWLIAGVAPIEMARRLAIHPSTVRHMIWRIRKPDDFIRIQTQKRRDQLTAPWW